MDNYTGSALVVIIVSFFALFGNVGKIITKITQQSDETLWDNFMTGVITCLVGFLYVAVHIAAFIGILR